MRLYNTLNNNIEELIKPDQTEINLFSCGPTTYDYIHIGNSRPIILCDLIIRTLKIQKIQTFFVQNITDIDDKIIIRAKQKNKSELELADYYAKSYFANLQKLNIIMPSHIEKISNFIEDQVKFIQNLIKKKAGYVKQGNVYFDTKQFTERSDLFYTQLSKKDLNKMVQQENRNQIKNKKNFADFALWKKTKEGISFNSPWGKGRPGWHTECCVLNQKIFKGKTIDLHVGGIDLKFPHNENERIQYIAINKKELSRIWLFNGHLNINNTKMSKSLNNYWYLHDFLNEYSSDILRLIYLNSSYSKPLNITNTMIAESQKMAKKLVNTWKKIQNFQKESLLNLKSQNNFYLNSVVHYLNDNLNTSNAISVLHKLVKQINLNLKLHKLTKQNVKDFKAICFEIFGLTLIKKEKN